MRLQYSFLCRIPPSHAILLCFFLLERYSGPPKVNLMLPRKYCAINTHKINTTSLHDICNVSVLYFMPFRNIRKLTYWRTHKWYWWYEMFLWIQQILYWWIRMLLCWSIYSNDNCTSWFNEAANRKLDYLKKIASISTQEKKQEWKFWVKQLQCDRNLHQSQPLVRYLSRFGTIFDDIWN